MSKAVFTATIVLLVGGTVGSAFWLWKADSKRLYHSTNTLREVEAEEYPVPQPNGIGHEFRVKQMAFGPRDLSKENLEICAWLAVHAEDARSQKDKDDVATTAGMAVAANRIIFLRENDHVRVMALQDDLAKVRNLTHPDMPDGWIARKVLIASPPKAPVGQSPAPRGSDRSVQP